MPNTYEQLKNEKIGLCVSGGLDSRTIANRLRELGIDLVCFTADLAQPDETDIGMVQNRMARCGVETVIVDLKNEMAETCFDAIRSLSVYDGGYWNTTGLARAVTVRGILPELRKRGCTVLAHGATGRGNDQIRFERYTNVLTPEMKVYAPWRDPRLLTEFPGRLQMIQYLKKCGIDVEKKQKKRYSTDANLAGLSHEAEDLESLETPCTIVETTMGVWPHDAPDKIEICTVAIERGRVTTINEDAMTPIEVMMQANTIGGRNGIGIKNALENRVIGTKSRGVYESPGMELLGFCMEQVYQAVLDRRSALLFRQLSRLIADQVYDGRLFDPATRAAQAAIKEFARVASGEVTVGLYKGNIYFYSLKNCPAQLYNMADSSMEASTGLNPTSSQGFVEVQSVEARSLAKAGQIEA